MHDTSRTDLHSSADLGIEEAWRLHASRHYAEALAIAKALLDESEDLAALDLAARCSWSLGGFWDAEEYWKRALRASPDCAGAHNNLGALFTEMKRFPEAQASYERALCLRPDYLEANNNLGGLHLGLGHLEEAIACFQRVISARPDDETAQYKLGILLVELKGFAEAEAHFRLAIAIRPEFAEAHNSLGVLLMELKRLAEAHACLLQALSIAPDYIDAHNNLGTLLAKLKFFEEAEASYQKAVALHPDFPEAHYNLGKLLTEVKRWHEAEACYRRAIALRKDHPESYYNLANILTELKRFQEAEAYYRGALSYRPDYPEVLVNFGNLLARLKRRGEAELCYRRALSLRPDFPKASWGLSLLLLSLGRYSEGWTLYESRQEQDECRIPDLPCPKWSGEDLHGKSLVVWPEQGFGDEIQFVRYVPRLKALGAVSVTLVCKAALKRLFLDSATGADQVLSEEEAGQTGPHDFWTFPLSFPLYFKTTLDNMPVDLPYLAADHEKMRRWGERLPKKGCKVGLVWRGSAGHRTDADRSLAGLASLAPLWSVPGVTFISLQIGEGEVFEPLSAQPILSLGSEIRDFADTAAIVSQLNLVICVDTAIAHLSGALGKPCWVMLPWLGTDWRWMDEREESPWYPGPMRLFRQKEKGDWDEVVRQVAAELNRFAADTVVPPLPRHQA